jgi:hypothetical protein
MKTNKLTAVENEVLTIINDKTTSRAAKLQALNNVKLDGRPGKKDAETLIEDYTKKFDKYLQGRYIKSSKYIKGLSVAYSYFYQKTTPRGIEIPLQKSSWAINFQKHFKYFQWLSVFNLPAPDKTSKTWFTYKQADKILSDFCVNTGLSPLQYGKTETILSFENSRKNHTTFKGYTITTSEDIDKDWDYYAKSYHYPKVTVSNRTIRLYTVEKCIDISIEAYRGSWLINALVKQFNIQPVKCPAALKPIQLNKYFGLNLIRKFGNAEIYERTLDGEHLDFCALHNGTTFHAETIKDAIAGCRNKQHAAAKFETEIINKQTGYDLGFCDPGMNQFCNDNNLDIEANYQRKELIKIVSANRSINKKYANELKQLGINL